MKRPGCFKPADSSDQVSDDVLLAMTASSSRVCSILP